jgi:hypothetical protein
MFASSRWLNRIFAPFAAAELDRNSKSLNIILANLIGSCSNATSAKI